MLYYFRIYGRGWCISCDKDSIKRRYKAYKDKGLARQPIRTRKNLLELD